MNVLHGLSPILSRQARAAVLGSFPAEASLRAQQDCAHPCNPFWPMRHALWGVDLSGADRLLREATGLRVVAAAAAAHAPGARA